MRDYRKPRNPRYATEYLERKLSPSAMMGTMTTTSTATDPTPTDPYPIEYPPCPDLNPVGPA